MIWGVQADINKPSRSLTSTWSQAACIVFFVTSLAGPTTILFRNLRSGPLPVTATAIFFTFPFTFWPWWPILPDAVHWNFEERYLKNNWKRINLPLIHHLTWALVFITIPYLYWFSTAIAPTVDGQVFDSPGARLFASATRLTTFTPVIPVIPLARIWKDIMDWKYVL